jgi:NAD(P)-dependent dehydrogenase (short-subunit alcohol dehydrogenase family)|tara:strand:+ start:3220 stop:3363 length:144 start_codon:yes stop_codon:yes gene_type:complete
VKLNVASTDDIEAFKQQVGDKPIDLLVNIAGMRVPNIANALEDLHLR